VYGKKKIKVVNGFGLLNTTGVRLIMSKKKPKKVKLKGEGISKVYAYKIIWRARRAMTREECPYRRNTVKWSVWITAFNNRSFSSDEVYNALVTAGAPINKRVRLPKD